MSLLAKLSCFRLWLSYHGARFAGFQAQGSLRTVQDELEKAIFAVTAQRPILTVAGRTDSGVHAHGQVVSLQLNTRLTPRQLSLALASKLPKDLSVWRIDRMPLGFDARRQSIGKQYIYRINQKLVHDLWSRDQSWQLKSKLEVSSMQVAAQYLVGEHDFSSFRSSLCGAAHAVRYVWLVDVKAVGAEIIIDVRGNAFCLNMVRIIVGTLVAVGLDKINSMNMPDIIRSQDRRRAGQTAPAHGLSFAQAYYPDNLVHAAIPDHASFPRYPINPESWPIDNSLIEYGPE